MTVDRVLTRYCLSVVGLALLAGCGGDAQADDQEVESSEPLTYSRVINVQVRKVEPVTFTETIRLTGVVMANQDVGVSAEESGVIEKLFADKGSRLRKGQAIAKIADALLSAQVKQAEARASLAKEIWERRKRLFEDDSVGSEQEYLEAKFSAEEAQWNLEGLKERLARTVIRAPFSGVMDDRLVEVGSRVAPGSTVARIVNVDPLKIVAGVPERYGPDVHVGAAASVVFDVLPDSTFEGTVSFVSATVNSRARTFEIAFVLPNPGNGIKPAMVANIEVVRRVLEGSLVVPREALVRQEDGFVVFVVEGGGDDARATLREVSVGASQSNVAVVTEGLSGGERLIVVGQHQVANGDRVQVLQGPEEGAE